MHRVLPILMAAAIVLSASLSYAQSPARVPVHGHLADSAGAAIEGPLPVKFALYTDASGMMELWSETQTVAFDRGAFAVQLGTDNPIDLRHFRDYSAVYLGISVDGDAEMELIELASVPWAAYAAYCGNAVSFGGMSVDDVYADFSSRGGGGTTHDRYTDAEAVTAMGAVSDTNPLNHNRFGPSDAVSAMGAVGDTNSLNHSRYTDDEARAALSGGGTTARPAVTCEAVLALDPSATSGVYWLYDRSTQTPWQGYCDMDTEGGGWLDLVASFNIAGQNTAALAARFFRGPAGVTISGAGATNASGVDGFYVQSDQAPSHQQAYYLQPANRDFAQVRMSWRMQGGEEGTRCTTTNWIPLNGPGYNGDNGGYLAACPGGYSCLQGLASNGRDAPIDATYRQDWKGSLQLLTWSGSNTGPLAQNCARDSEIPIDQPALWFDQLLIR